MVLVPQLAAANYCFSLVSNRHSVGDAKPLFNGCVETDNTLLSCQVYCLMVLLRIQCRGSFWQKFRIFLAPAPLGFRLGLRKVLYRRMSCGMYGLVILANRGGLSGVGFLYLILHSPFDQSKYCLKLNKSISRREYGPGGWQSHQAAIFLDWDFKSDITFPPTFQVQTNAMISQFRMSQFLSCLLVANTVTIASRSWMTLMNKRLKICTFFYLLTPRHL